MKHFKDNNIFSKKQYGFKTGRSTVLQLLNILDTWTAKLEEGGCENVIYTDFEKAFDKVPHERLLSKLRSYGISEDIIAWIKKCLCCRKHRFKIKGKFSKWFKVLSDIPQGSVLGPLLFIIYINDLAEACEGHASTFLFADDAKIFQHIKSQVDKHKLQQTCDTMGTWSERWLMPLNAKKCTILRIGKDNKGVDNNCCIKVGEVTTNLAKATSIKDLGVIVDENLSFKELINSKIK